MKRLFLSVLTVLVLLAVVSCKPCREITTTVHDTVSHEVTVTRHDTLITTLPDSAGWSAFFECRKNAAGLMIPVMTNQHTTSGSFIHVNTNQNSTQTGLNVNVECKSDSLKARITLLEKTIKDFRDKETVKEIPINYLTGFQWAQVWAGRVLILLVVLFVIWQVLKRYTGLKL